MALKTLGTNANNSFSAFLVGTNDVITADVASLNVALLNDLINGRPKIPNGYAQKGVLYIPNRGVLLCRDGDYIAWDSTTGWPILISADCAANGAVTHS